MTIKYICDIDGAEFDSEYACEVHENELMRKEGADIIFGLNEDGEKISFLDGGFCEEVHVLYLASTEAVEIFADRCRFEDMDCGGIEFPGTYIWNDGDFADCDRGWNSAEEVIFTYESKISDIKELIQEVENN